MIDSDAASLDVTGTTRLFFVIGDPIAQVLSTRLYNLRAAAFGADVLFAPYQFSAQDFDVSINGLRAVRNLAGIIPTIPHKARMLNVVDTATDRAKAIGAVNSIRVESTGDWIGDALDGVGYANGLVANGINPAGLRFQVIGAGGAGSSICHELAARNAASVRVHDRLSRKAEAVADSVKRQYPNASIKAGMPGLDVNVIVNASPCGMASNDPLPISLGDVDKDVVVTDMIMRPETTRFLKEAVARGCRIVRGHEALVGQAEANLRFLRIVEDSVAV